MKKLISILLLLICITTVSCSSGGGSSPSNEPVITSISPLTGDWTTLITVRGANLGLAESDNAKIYYCYYPTNGGDLVVQKLTADSWTNTAINVRLYQNTLLAGPTGTFKVIINGIESHCNQTFTYSGAINPGNISITPSKIYSYNTNNDRSVTISGKGFGAMARDLTLYSMNSTDTAYTISKTNIVWSDTSIRLWLPNSFFTSTTTVGIRIKTDSVNTVGTFFGTFEYAVSEINSFNVSPNSASAGDAITISTINGGFGTQQPTSNFSLTVGNAYVNTFSSWSDSNISFILPSTASNNTSEDYWPIVMNIYGKQITNNTSLAIKPRITDITRTGGGLLSDYTYYITGKGFNQNSIVVVNPNTAVTVTSYDSQSITLTSKTNFNNYQLRVYNKNTSATSEWFTKNF